MVAYSFKQQFVEPILSGRKPHTIRAERTGRTRHARPGDALQLYTGMRTKKCLLFARATCDKALPISIHTRDGRRGRDLVAIEGHALIDTYDKLDAFAQSDGFSGWPEMREWWNMVHGAREPFHGRIIFWTNLEPMR